MWGKKLGYRMKQQNLKFQKEGANERIPDVESIWFIIFWKYNMPNEHATKEGDKKNKKIIKITSR